MELHPLILSLLILIIVSDTQARSLETPVQCATTCTESENVLFRPDQTYYFSYNADVESSFQTDADSDSKTTMRIRTTVLVDALSTCELVLRLQNTDITTEQLLSSDSQEAWIESLEQNPLHFSWNDGRIPDVCASNDDPKWVLNIKRGILSVMQVSSIESADNVKETDVTGRCKSSFSVESDGTTRTINKSKDYNTCQDRDEYLLFSYFTSYNIDSPRQNFIYSSQNCQQEIVNGLINRVQCAEKHTFRPFSNEQSGAQTKIIQRLELLQRRSSLSSQPKLTAANSRRTGITFEKESDVTEASRDITETQLFFRDLCARMNDEDYVQVGKDFVKLIALLRRLDSSALEQVRSSLDGTCGSRRNAFRQMFEDALQWCGSEGCVVFTARLIAQGRERLSDDVANRWLNGMSLITKPTLPMLSSVMEIVQSGRMPETSYLIAGTMIHRLCETSTGNCLSQPDVRNALVFFEEKLGSNCHTASENRKQEILLALRALGNAGRTNSISTLVSCVAETDNDMETRIATIDAFRRMPCGVDRSVLSRMLSDISQDSEIRIGSYLGLMKCPTPTLIEQLIIQLDGEDVQQVASYIWSHLNQLMESKDPLKGYIKPLLMETEFAKKHDLDPRKYSRYYEASIFSDQLNAGATFESSVIWSPKSFVPRSADLGLTVDVFGQAVNLLEVGGRAEGIEALIQSAMASDNFLKDNPLDMLFAPNSDAGSDDDEDDEDAENESEEVAEMDQRSARSTDTQLVERHRRRFKSGVNTENIPNANWYFRVFGNEMMYGNLRSLKRRPEVMNVQSVINRLIQTGQYEYHDNSMIMNSQHILPTGVGLPLTVAFNGSASVDINVNGQMDLKSLFNTSPSMTLNGLFEPRATVVVSGTMAVDAHLTKIGIATESSVLTSMRMSGKATLRNGRDLDVVIDTPYNKNTFFTFNHKLMKVIGEEMENFGDEQRNVINDCTQEIAGQRFCIEKPRRFEIFPVTGPLSMSAYINKTESDIQKYQLSGQINTENFPTAFSMTLEADTPNTRTNRLAAINFQYNLASKNFSLNYNGYGNAYNLEGQVESETTRKTLALTYTRNEVVKRFESTFEHRRTGDQRTWIATSQLQLPDQETISSIIHASIDPYRNLSANISIENLYSSPVVGNISLQDKSETNSLNYYGEAYLKIPNRINNGGNFNLKFLPRSDNFKFGLDYEFNNMRKERIIFNHKRQNLSTRRQTQWRAHQKFTMTQYPVYNHHADLSFSNDEEGMSSMVKFSYGRQAGQHGNQKFILFNESFSYSNTESRKGFNGHFKLVMPQLPLRFSANVDHLRDNALFNTTVTVQDYAVQLVMQNSPSENGLLNKSIHVEIPTPWGSVRIEDTIVETRKNVYELTGSFRLGSSRGLAMRGTCTLENLRQRKRISLNVEGDNNQNLLSAESLLEFSNDFTFVFNNNMRSKYNNLITLNIRREAYQLDGTRNEIVFEHQPTKYYSVVLASTNDYATLSFKYNDYSGMRRFMTLEGTKIMNENHYNGTLSFTTNDGILEFRNLAVSADYSTSSSRVKIETWYKKDDSEIMGMDFTHLTTPSQTSLSLHLRQQVCRETPRDIQVEGSFVRSGNPVVSASLRFDQVEKIRGRFHINYDEITARGNIRHQFDQLNIPSSVDATIQIIPDRASLTLNYASQEIAIRINRESETSTGFYFVHDDQNLDNYFLPRNIEAHLNHGLRTSDNGKGVWLTAALDRGNFNSELMLFKNRDSNAVVFKIDHNLEQSKIPEVNAKAYNQRDQSNKIVGAFVESNNVNITNVYFDLASNAAEIVFTHQLPVLSSVPRNIRAKGSLEGIISRLDATLLLELNDLTTQMNIRTNQNREIVNFQYNSDMFYSLTNLGFVISQSENEISFNITKGAATFDADFTLNINEQPLLDFSLRQNLFIDGWFVLPRKMKLLFESKQNRIDLSWKYNRYSGLIEIDHQRDLSSNNGMISLRWRSREKLRKVREIPQNFEVALSLTNGNTGSANLTWNDQSISTSAMIDTSRKSFTFTLQHTFDALNNFGLSDSLSIAGSANLLRNEQAKTIDFEGNIEIDDNNYRVYFHNYLDIDAIPVQINTTFGHNIVELSEMFNIPLEIALNNTLSYSMESDYSSITATLNTDISRAYLENQNPVENNMQLSLTFMPFTKKLDLSFLHDFSVPEYIPRLLKFDVSVSIPVGQSAYTYRGLNIGLQRDSLKEVGELTFSVRKAPGLKQSVTFVLRHNATQLYIYGIPKTMTISLEGNSIFNTELGITYDTSRKSIGFEIDFHGNKNHLVTMFYHNFTMLSNIGIPKRLGFDIKASADLKREAELTLTTYYNKQINNGHITIGWNIRDYSFEYKHHHNASAIDFIPKEVKAEITNTIEESEIISNARIRVDKSLKIHFRSYLSKNPSSGKMVGAFELKQKGIKTLPRMSELEIEMSTDEILMNVMEGRDKKLGIVITPTLNKQNLYASIQVEVHQIINLQYPQSIFLYSNSSIHAGADAYLKLLTNSNLAFEMDLKSKYNLENNKFSLALIHSENSWQQIIPRNINVTLQYDLSMTTNSIANFELDLDVLWGTMEKSIDFSTNYASPKRQTFYLDANLQHDINNLGDYVPLQSRVAVLFELDDTTGILQANASVDDQVFTHSAEVTYNGQDNDIEASIKIKINNEYLTALEIPYLLGGELTANWENPIETNLKTDWNAESANFHFFFDPTSKAEFNVSHTFNLLFRNIDFVLKLPISRNVQVIVGLDGEEKTIDLTGDFNQGSGQIEFTHNFENLPAKQVTLECNYRLTPDYHVAVVATVDGEEYRVEGGFRNLNNGFHVTTTLLDNISRSFTGRYQTISGGMSLEIEHSIPELSNFIPESAGVSASIQQTPNFNLTASVRKQDKTQMFTAAVDTSRLQFRLTHDFESLPIPQSMLVQITTSPNPLVRVIINDFERFVSLSVDRSNLRVQLTHVVPELDQWFVPRDLILGIKLFDNSIGGELYVSIDGDERRLGGSAGRGIINLYQTLSESSIPRNITLNVSGTLWPLNGAVSLTIDEIERLVGTQINTRSWFLATTIQVPELEPYVPRHVSAKLNFDKYSAQFAASFFKNNRNQTFVARYDVQGPVHIEITQNLEFLSDLPSHLEINLDLNKETKTVSVRVTVNDDNVSLIGKLLIDRNGWYGITINGNHNFRYLTKQWKIARKPEIELLGKLEDKTFSGDVSIKLIKRHFFDADFSITPTWKRKRKGLAASYIHAYEDLTRNVTGSLFFIKQRGDYRFSFDGKQMSPLEKAIELDLSISPPSSQEVSFTLEATAKQNLDELLSRQIPERILGHIALNVNPDEMRAHVESALTYDETSVSLAVDLHPENTAERISINANATVSKNRQGKEYSLRAQYLPQEGRGDGRFEVTNTETETMERSDHVSFHYTVSEQILTGAIGVQQRELIELGVPQEMYASLERSEEDINKHWRFNFTIAGEPTSVVIDFVQDNSPFRLDVGASFDSATSLLTDYDIPSHAAIRLTASSNSGNLQESFKVEYEDKFFLYSSSQSRTEYSGTASQEMRTNFENVSEWLGGSNVLETYSYSINDQQLQLLGSVTKDGAVTAIYNFTMDLQTKEFTYNGLYHEHGYDIVFRNVHTDEKRKLVFIVSQDEQPLVNIDLMLSETNGDFLIAYDFSSSQNLYEMPYHFLMRETFALKKSEVNQFEETFRLEYNEEFVKGGVSVNWSKNSGNVGYEIESNAQEFRKYLGFGKIKEIYEYNFSNEMFSLVSHTTIDNAKVSNSTFVLNGKEYTLKCSFNENGYEAIYRNSFTDEDKSLLVNVDHNGKTIFRLNVRLPTNNQASFDFELIHRIKYLKKLGLVKVIRAEGVYEQSTGALSVSITAGSSTLLEIERSSQEMTAKIRNFRNNLIFDANANYRLHPEKFVKVQISSSPLNLETDLTTKLVMFERGTGNSSLNFVLNINSNQFSISGFAVPSSTHDAADFLARLETSSTFAVLPFSVGMMYNSTMDIQNSHYIGDYKAVVNSQTVNVQVDSSLKHINISITQPWFTCAPVLSFSSKMSIDSDNNKILRTKIQWTEQLQDSLSFTGKMKNTGTKISYFAQISQPSNLLSISNIAAGVFGDFNTRDVYSVGFNTVVDEYENGINATYTGVLPHLFGTHDLNVNVTQSFLNLPSKSTTKGLITISQSLYNSSWSIKSNGRQLVSLEKTFSKGNNRAALTLKWRQTLFDRMRFSYANMEFVAGANSGRAQMQIDDMPEMSASYEFGNDEENHNKTLTVEINSGLLSNLVKFRTLSWSSWLKHEDSQKYNHNSHTVFIIDGKTHFFNLEYVGVVRNSKTHWKVDTTIGHPYNLNVFGTTLPKTAQASFKLMHKNGGRVFFTYTDNTRQKPFGIKSTYGLQDASRLFSVKTTVNLEHCEDPFEIDVSLKRNSLTVSVQCAEKQLNHEMVIEFKNNAELLDLSYSLKNFIPRPKEQTELAVSFMKTSGVMEIRLASPKIERTVLRGDLSSILSQSKRLVQAILSESRTSSLTFIHSINRNQDEYDMYVGYQKRRGATYTLHLRTSWNSGAPFAAVEMKKNFELQAELARAAVKLIEGRLIQIKFNGNPALINFVRTAIQNIDGEIEHKINVLAENVIKALNLIKPVVVKSDQRRENFVSQIDELIAKVEEAKLTAIRFVREFSNSCTDKFSLVELATETGARNALTSLLEKIESVKDVIARPFTEVYNQYVGVMIRKTNSAIIEKLQPVIVILRKVNAGELLIELVEEGIQNTYDYVMRNGEVSFSLLRQPLSDLLYVDESNVILNIPLDIDISELKPLPTLEDIKTWLARSALASTINNGIEKLYSYADDYYKARALIYIPRDEILPPFKGHAFVSDFRHFSTFDKRHYNFSSGCPTSHVLAADMRDNNFTVAITYGDPTDRRNMHNGIEVVVGNSHVIVYENYVVKLNNRRKELPLVLDNMSVLLEGSTIHVRRNNGDLDVACDFTKKLCSVDVSPYYFGATAGMAGIYNNEPMDDFKAPSREDMDTAAELAAAWESTGTECSTGNTYEPCRETAQRCISLFKESDSPLRACFPLVDPEPFMAMCNSDMCDNSESSCASVHAYAYRCALVGARVKLPDECVSCSMVDETQQFDSSMSRNTRISSVDLVLVVEQGRCMGERYGISRTAKKFLKKLSTSMKRQRVRHIRYQLVGYGGPGASASPNTITIRRSPTTKSHKQLKKAIQKIAMSSKQVHADTLSAISYASQLPFRAGAKPIIVVLPCDSCHASKVSYSDVEWQIRKRGISLHHVPQGQIRAGRNSKSIYGFDQDNAFSQENRSVSSVFIKPNKNDMCEPLATRTGGSVWDQEKMNNNRFIAKFSDYLASKVNKGDHVRCECEVNEAGIATSVCTAVDQH